MNGAQYIAKRLEQMGVDTLFGYPGGCIMPLYDALLETRIRHILCRHEQAAAFAAEGYARASGRVGVCLATSGPGATNLITGLADAYMDSVPMVAITGQVPTGLIGTDAFQETDILGLSLPITKQSYLVERVEQLPAIIEEAFRIAGEGRPGPVLIDLPKDIQLAELVAVNAPGFLAEGAPAPDPEALARALTLLCNSKRPVVYSGGGVSLGRAIEPFRRFVETTGIPAVATLKGLGNLPAAHPLNMGMLGMHGSRAANRLVQESDLLIAVGARFDDRVTGKLSAFAPEAEVIHLDIDPAEIGKLRSVCCSVPGDIGQSLEALTLPLDFTDWSAHARTLLADSGFGHVVESEGITPPLLLRALAAAAGEDAVVSCDVGQHQMWVAQYYPISHPRRHLSSGGLGAMGFGLPAAIGAQIARPDALVINVTGDGSFMMNMQELATLGRYRLPVKILVLDNQRLGMVRQQQTLCYQGRHTEVDLSDNPDFAAVARAFGIDAERIEGREGLEAAIERLLHTPGPALLQVPIASEASVWPMVKPGDSNDEMITGDAA